MTNVTNWQCSQAVTISCREHAEGGYCTVEIGTKGPRLLADPCVAPATSDQLVSAGQEGGASACAEVSVSKLSSSQPDQELCIGCQELKLDTLLQHIPKDVVPGPLRPAGQKPPEKLTCAQSRMSRVPHWAQNLAECNSRLGSMTFRLSAGYVALWWIKAQADCDQGEVDQARCCLWAAHTPCHRESAPPATLPVCEDLLKQ